MSYPLANWIVRYPRPIHFGSRVFPITQQQGGTMFPDEYIAPDEDSSSLIGVDGNAINIMGHVTRSLKRAGNPSSVLDAYRQLAMSGDYDHLLAVSMAYLDGDEKMLEILQVEAS